MLVSDLNHFLDLPDDVPAPARRLAQHLGNIVRAATAGGDGAGDPWMSALPCRRRPAHRPCAGRITIVRHQPPAPIQWRCSVCADEGVISNWEDSPYALRRRRLTVPEVFDEPIHRNDLPTRDQQQREHAALARAAEVKKLDRAARLDGCVQRTKHTDPQHDPGSV